MPALSVGGLVSGLDTNSIIAQLTAIEQNKVTRELQKKDKAQSTLDQFKELQTRLSNLAAKASGLALPNKFSAFKATSNYEDYATVSGKDGATPGNYNLKINQLASNQKVASNAFDSTVKPFGVSTSIFISVSEAAKKADPRKSEVEVKISATDTLKDIQNKINSAEGSSVKAGIEYDNTTGKSRLILTAVDSGTNSFYLRENATGGKNLLTDELGILTDNVTKAVSNYSMLTLDGKAATGSTTFDQLKTVSGLNKNDLSTSDSIGVFIPGTGWKKYDVYDSETGAYKTIDKILSEMNSNAITGLPPGVTASINNSGEIVLEGGTGDNLSGFRIQILSFNGSFNENDLNNLIAGIADENVDIGELLDQMGIDLDDLDIDPNATLLEKIEAAMFTVKKSMGSFNKSNAFSEVTVEGQNAVYSIDGNTISSKSNNDETSRPGTVFELKKVTKDIDSVKVSLELDVSAVADKIKEFVEEFNSLMKFIDDQARAIVKEDTDDKGKKTTTRITGPFTGETTISSLRENLRSMFTNVINELAGNLKDSEGKNIEKKTEYSSASRLGILTKKDGSLEVDSEKLEKALKEHFDEVSRLFTANNFSSEAGFSIGRFTKNSKAGVYETDGHDVWFNGKKLEGVTGVPDGTILTTADGLSIEIPKGFFDDPENAGKKVSVTFVRGIADQLSNFVEKAKDTIGGLFKQTEEMYTKRIEDLEKRASQLQRRVDNFNERLIKQFTSLEKSMGNLQSQSSNMMSALSAMTTSYGNNNK
ncbi:MAG: flagellar filament capping protein FliD [Candidatus Fibromonas sp.]|jgi:flagellar hook-associated protein 2|nr:flagellar filament capping protein FliD [Candidatus Fibromonas sp.]